MRFALPFLALVLGAQEKRRKAIQQAYEVMKKTDPAKAEQFRRQAETLGAAMDAKRSETAASSQASARDGVAFTQKYLDAIRRELAAMSPAERASQAWHRRTGEDYMASGLMPAGREGAGPLVAINPDFFDEARPRSDVQLISVYFGSRAFGKNHIATRRMREFFATADWGRVAALLD
jgi:hypothetical protein